MDLLPNPYSPGSGQKPPHLAGREALLEHGQSWWPRLAQGTPAPGLLVEGLKGSGKTSALDAVAEQGRQAGAQLALVEAHERRPLALLLYPALRGLAHAQAQGAARSQALAVLAGFRLAHTPRLPAPPADPPAVPGLGDSGDLEADLGAALGALGAARGPAALALLLDGAECLHPAELAALLRAQHATARRGSGVGLALGGLPFLDRLSGDSRDLAAQLFQAFNLEPLDAAAAAEACQVPARALGRGWRPAALGELWRRSKGNPALLQAWARRAWDLGRSPDLDESAVRAAEAAVLGDLDQHFYGPGFDRLSPREKAYLRSMAHLGPGPHRSGDIADSMDAKITALGPLRAQLMAAGWVYSPGHGWLGFTAPGMDEYMRRVMPNFR